MAEEEYIQSIRRCMDWICRNMLTFNNGYNGIYERIRIDKNIRTNWVRPDCNAEMASVMALYRRIFDDDRYETLYQNVTEWLIRTQDSDPLSAWYGAFPFFVTDGHKDNFELKCGETVFQNDNGKVLLAFVRLYRDTRDARFLESAIRLADFWVSVQRSEGWFARRDGRVWHQHQGPCFVLWLAAGLAMRGRETGNEKYGMASRRAFDYVLSLMLENGRMKTSWETIRAEDWRPASSETAIALYALGIALAETGDSRYIDPLRKTAGFLLSLQDQTGGIRNCDDTCREASLQNNARLCDLVYTQGYALMALAQAWRATGDGEYLAAARKLAGFLTGIQCAGESPLWDGAWRGSYNIETMRWDGRADQNNTIDEGGMYSVYTGWCAAPIMYGLLLLL